MIIIISETIENIQRQGHDDSDGEQLSDNLQCFGIHTHTHKIVNNNQTTIPYLTII